MTSTFSCPVMWKVLLMTFGVNNGNADFKNHRPDPSPAWRWVRIGSSVGAGSEGRLGEATWLSAGFGNHGVTQYPARWTIRIPSVGLELDVRPLLANQELRVAFRY